MTVSVTFEVDRAGVDRLLHSPSGPYGQWLARMGNRAASEAVRRANVDTGLMRSTITFTVVVEGGTLVGVLAARTAYAKYVHDGTRFYAGNPFLTSAVRDTLR